jgi:enterobactin synthetase component D
MDFVDNQPAQARHKRLESALQARLGPQVAVVCTGVDGDVSSLLPDERPAMLRAVPKRQREFAAGRAAAREAMRRLCGIQASIPANPDRSPRWPQGLVGSITHTRDICLVVVGDSTSWQSIGIDMEPDCGIDQSLWETLCTPAEHLRLEQQPAAEQAAGVARLFVAKEAFYKWHYPIEQTILEFQEVSVAWGPGGSEFSASKCGSPPRSDSPGVRGLFWTLEGHLIACVATPRKM